MGFLDVLYLLSPRVCCARLQVITRKLLPLALLLLLLPLVAVAGIVGGRGWGSAPAALALGRGSSGASSMAAPAACPSSKEWQPMDAVTGEEGLVLMRESQSGLKNAGGHRQAYRPSEGEHTMPLGAAAL